jgi:hypothetical protein
MSNIWVRTFVVALLALAVTTSPALASKETAGRVYFIGGLGMSDVDVKDESVFEGETDGSDTAWQLGAGWYLNEWVGFEVAYTDLGEASFDGLWGPEGERQSDVGTITASGLRATVLANWWFASRWALFGKLGAYFYDVQEDEVYAGFPETWKSSGTAPEVGLGVQWGVASRVDLRAYWSRYFDVGEEETTGVRDYDALLLDVMFRIGPRKKK